MFTMNENLPKKNPFKLPDQLTTNLNAIQSNRTRKSVDIDSNNQLTFDPPEQALNKSLIEQRPVQSHAGLEASPHDTKSISKSPYQIPSPTIFLPGEFSSSSKTIANSNMIRKKIERSIPIENHQHLLLFNQRKSFHSKKLFVGNDSEIISLNSDQISISSLNSLNLLQPLSSPQLSPAHKRSTPQQSQTFRPDGFTIDQSAQQTFPTKQSNVILPRFIDKANPSNRHTPSPTISLSQMEYDRLSLTLSQDLGSTSFDPKIDNENLHLERSIDVSSVDASPQMKIRHEIKHQSESLWKTKLTLKTLLAMANRDKAQALKDRKPVDYHLFLTNKFDKKNSIFQYHDQIDTKFTRIKKDVVVPQINEIDHKANRKFYKRLLKTMGLCKAENITRTESIMPIKQIKTKCRTKKQSATHTQTDTRPFCDDPIFNRKNHPIDNPVLITYQVVPVSASNRRIMC